MRAPEIPPEEPSRIEALRSLQVLDTPPTESFDRLTRLAKRMFDVPIALVSLVDENRQWFKSCVGLEASETPRDISFCGHAILGSGVFIIPDALQDERFADNPLVLNRPNIRFYAGCPLALNGHKLGTLCLIDRKPRTFDDEDVESLQDLAVLVERELNALQLATSDELTGIANRRGFRSLAQHSLNLCARQKLPAALVFMDLDKLKAINDRYGHAEGDRALMALADQMKNRFRNSDIVARLGGDEFVLLLSNTSKQQAEAIMIEVERALEEFNRTADRGYDVAFSYGIVEAHHDENTLIEALLARGDTLMYEVKQAKR